MRIRPLIALALGIQACSFEEVKDESIVVAATFSSISTNVIQNKCISCHSSSNPKGGVDLSSHARTVATAGVVSGSPSTSALYTQVQSGVMPQGASKLPDQHIQAINDWITNGALDN